MNCSIFHIENINKLGKDRNSSQRFRWLDCKNTLQGQCKADR